MTIIEKINLFLAEKSFAVAGASSNREKYGNKVLRCYQQHQLDVFPINNKTAEIEGIKTIMDVTQLPTHVKALSIITPPLITETIVEQAIKKGIKHIWMQPGAESSKAIRMCEDAGINLIADGSCVLVVMHYREL